MKFNSAPDPGQFPPATAVTPQQLAESEKAVQAARTPEEKAAAEAIHQALFRAQYEQLLKIHQQRELQRFMPTNL